MRKTFYELLDSFGVDAFREYSRLNNLFFGERISTPLGPCTMQRYINERYFRGFKFRGTYTDISEMIDDIIPDINTLDDLFIYCEFLLAVLFDSSIMQDKCIDRQAAIIVENIVTIMEKTNYELFNKGTKEEPRYIIVEKNKATTLAAEIVDDKAISIDLIEYNRYSLKGDLEAKRRLLDAIGHYIEPILRAHTLKSNGYAQLESDAGFLLNNFHIRHNNKEGGKAQDYIVRIHDYILEEWYDKAYGTLLSVIIINDQIRVTSELAALKRDYEWRT